MKSFVLNRHGGLFLPSTSFSEIDFSVIDSIEQYKAIIRRDIESKAPSGTDILAKIDAGGYSSRLELLRDLALNLYWANR